MKIHHHGDFFGGTTGIRGGDDGSTATVPVGRAALKLELDDVEVRVRVGTLGIPDARTTGILGMVGAPDGGGGIGSPMLGIGRTLPVGDRGIPEGNPGIGRPGVDPG